MESKFARLIVNLAMEMIGSHYQDKGETYHIPCLYTSTYSIYSSHTKLDRQQTRAIITLLQMALLSVGLV